MENEHVDPVYKYIDGKIKLLKRELHQLKRAHDAIANKHAHMLLELQRVVVSNAIYHDLPPVVIPLVKS